MLAAASRWTRNRAPRFIRPHLAVPPRAQRVVKDACSDCGLQIRVQHEPDPKNPSPAYTAVRRYRSDNLELLELLAGEAWCHEAVLRV
jgi:hypothetical protein